MLPKISSGVTCLPSTRVLYHAFKPSKSSSRWYTFQTNYTQDLMTHTSKTLHVIHIYSTTSEESSRWNLYSSLFALVIILISSGLFLHRLSRLLTVKLKCLRAQKTGFSRQKCKTRRENTKSIKPSWKAINKPTIGLTKNRPYLFCTISKDRICHIISSRVESLERI